MANLSHFNYSLRGLMRTAELPAEYGYEATPHTFLCSGVLITGVIVDWKKKHQEDGMTLEGQPLVEMLRVEGTLSEMQEANKKDLDSLDHSPESNDKLWLRDAQITSPQGTVKVPLLNLRITAIDAYW